MQLMTKKIEAEMPVLGSQRFQKDPVCRVKFFTRDSNWTWYGIEYDPELFYFRGYGNHIQPTETYSKARELRDLHYFSLEDLDEVRGPEGKPVERDITFKPVALSEIKKASIPA